MRTLHCPRRSTAPPAERRVPRPGAGNVFSVRSTEREEACACFTDRPLGERFLKPGSPSRFKTVLLSLGEGPPTMAGRHVYARRGRRGSLSTEVFVLFGVICCILSNFFLSLFSYFHSFSYSCFFRIFPSCGSFSARRTSMSRLASQPREMQPCSNVQLVL